MIVENVNVYGIEESFKAAKYPFAVNTANCTEEYTARIEHLGQCEKGTGHDNFLVGIVVQFDLTFTVKAWTEAERYHFFDIVSSQSTMHMAAKFDIHKQCNEYVTSDTIARCQILADEYNDDPTPKKYLRLLYNLPLGFRLTARMTTNYRQLKTIYAQRRNHRLPEWQEFCKWIETLPYAELITRSNGDGNWIFCSERMPEDEQDVLVYFEYYRYGDYNRLFQTIGISNTYKGDWSGFVNGASGWRQLRILAWMPLPEPPEEK